MAGPLELKKKWEDNSGANINTPLDDFKRYENAQYIGAIADDDKKHYGVYPFGESKTPNYKDLIDSYSKSKGKFAAQFNDPEIKKYHDEQMARRNAAYDRVRKVPQDQWRDFAYGYGYFQDPYDFEGDPEDVGTVDEFINYFDGTGMGDIEILEDYLKEKGY